MQGSDHLLWWRETYLPYNLEKLAFSVMPLFYSHFSLSVIVVTICFGVGSSCIIISFGGKLKGLMCDVALLPPERNNLAWQKEGN